MSRCNALTLNEYVPSVSMPWDTQRAHHFYRRVAYGASPTVLSDALTKTPSDLVDALILEAQSRPDVQDPGWGNWGLGTFLNDYRDTFGIDISISVDTSRYVQNMYYQEVLDYKLRGKLLQFWYNHFVSFGNTIPPTYSFQKYQTYAKYLIGNFKEFVSAVGRDSKMLVFLNGLQNKATASNENYARELYELFTLGVDNGYTEQDIQETARALTGYNRRDDSWQSIYFNEATFDSSEKTIFGCTGNWGYDDVIDILFEEKGLLIAQYICTKLYKFFVSPDVNSDIINELAVYFVAHNFEIAPLLSKLFKSEHFMNSINYGTCIKSPQDLIFGMVKDVDMDFSPDRDDNYNLFKVYRSRFAGLEGGVFTFPNVAGWPGDEAWLSSVTILQRWEQAYNMVWYQRVFNNPFWVNFLKNTFAIDTPVEVVVKGLVDHFLTKPMSSELEYQNAIGAFKEGVPDIYFTDGTWDLTYTGVQNQILNLLKYIVKLPEFQLS